MGTRADFYVGRGSTAEWLGSIAFDGYPDGDMAEVLLADPPDSVEDYRQRVGSLLAGRHDATLPADGWPWPWDDSRTTDYSYAWDGAVWISCFGHRWSKDAAMAGEAEGGKEDFPDMSSRKRVALGGRSGLLVLGVRR